MKLLIVNSSNRTPNSNNQFVYNFPNNPTFDSSDQVAVTHMAVYNSTYNIEASRNNNTMDIIFNFATPVTLNVTFPDGYYTVDQMNTYLQSAMISAGYYATNTSNQNVYWFEVVTNAVLYAIQVNLFPIPTSAQATSLGLTQAVGSSWTWPTTASVPQLVTLNNAWPALIGFAVSTTFPVATQTTAISYTSSSVPVLSPVNSYVLRCNLINSPFSTPTDILDAMPINAGFGNLVISNASIPIWHDIAPNSYSHLTITFCDQHMNKLELHDFDILISLAFRKKGEE